MNRAAKVLTARDPLISAHAVRFLLMAGTNTATFLAGFRQRHAGEALSLWQGKPRSSVARQAKVHDGAGNFNSDAARGRIYLNYRTDRYDYSEDTVHFGDDGYSIVTELSVYGQHLPDTLLAALPGRTLRSVIGYDRTPAFFASRYTTIVAAEMSDFPGSHALDLILAVKWYPLSHMLSHLR
ncbi:hypothetical protein [Sphingomonas sp. UYP23]